MVNKAKFEALMQEAFECEDVSGEAVRIQYSEIIDIDRSASREEDEDAIELIEENFGEVPYKCDIFLNDGEVCILGRFVSEEFDNAYQEWNLKLVELVKEELKGC